MPRSYKNLDHEEFVSILDEILDDESANSLLLIPGVFEIVAEYYNNEILEKYDERQELAREQAQSDEGDDED